VEVSILITGLGLMSLFLVIPWVFILVIPVALAVGVIPSVFITFFYILKESMPLEAADKIDDDSYELSDLVLTTKTFFSVDDREEDAAEIGEEISKEVSEKKLSEDESIFKGA
jgi:uncharacterized protein (DUF2344 family)